MVEIQILDKPKLDRMIAIYKLHNKDYQEILEQQVNRFIADDDEAIRSIL